MEEVVKFLKECGAYFLATVDGDQPRVRPHQRGRAAALHLPLPAQEKRSQARRHLL